MIEPTYEVSEWYAKVGGQPRWHVKYRGVYVHPEGNFLVVTVSDEERLYLPATNQRYRVVNVTDRGSR